MITGIILAGGQSSRMGRDKACLPVGEEALIEMVARRLWPSVDRLIVVGNSRNRSILARQLRGLQVDAVLTDVVSGCGPLMGIYTGLMASETPLNVCVPCDMPWISARLLERLLRACDDQTTIVAGRRPCDGAQPFPLVCHVSACRLIGGLLDRREHALQALVRQPCARLVTVREPALWQSFTNINTWDDYGSLCRAPAMREHGWRLDR